MIPSERNFTVVSTGDTLKCIDAFTGTQFNTYRLGGMLVSGPVVTGDRATIVIRKGNTNHGIVLALPSFMQTSTFSA
jgi:hypothetical protein